MATSDYHKKMSAIFTGVMDSDSDPRHVKAGDYQLLVNGSVDIDEDGGRGVVKNIKSSSRITQLGDSLKCIGAREYNNEIYAFFVRTVTPNDTLFYRITALGSYTQIFRMQLGNTTTTKIHSIDIVRNQTTEELMCYWTDGENEPFKININWAITQSTFPSKETFYNIREVPEEPSITPRRDYSIATTEMRSNAFQFASRYIYADGEKTPLSTYSRTAFHPDSLFNDNIRAGTMGIYVSGGEVRSFPGFSSSTTTLLSDGYNVGYNRIIGNADFSILIMFSDDTSLPIKRSVDKGYSFVDVTTSSYIVGDGDMSNDGKYIFLATGPLFLISSTQGSSFEENELQNNSNVTNLRCSADGRFVAIILIKTSIPLYTGALVYSDFGKTMAYSKANLSTTTASCGISQTGKNVVFSMDTKLFVSTNYGTSFVEYDGRPQTDAISIYDNGFGIADGYMTTDNYATTTVMTHNATYIYPLVDSVFVKNVGRLYQYSLDGIVIADITSNQNIQAFSDAISVRDVSLNTGNFYNVVEVTVKEPPLFVKRIEVYAIDITSGIAYMAKNIKIDEVVFTAGEYSFQFHNSKIYRRLSRTEKEILFSNVPQKAMVQAFIGNRLFYLNYTDGANFPAVDFQANINYTSKINSILTSTILSTGNIRIQLSNAIFPVLLPYIFPNSVLNFSFSFMEDGKVRSETFTYIFHDSYNNLGSTAALIQTQIQTLYSGITVTGELNGLIFSVPQGFINVGSATLTRPLLTFKKGYKGEYGIVYYDKYNRGSYPQFSGGEIIVSDNINDRDVDVSITINSLAPEWAVRYKFVRTDRDLNYRIIPGFQYAKFDSGRIFLMKYSSDYFLPDVGDIMETHTDDGRLISFDVIWRGTMDASFYEGAPTGEWIAITAPSIGPFSGTAVLGGTSAYYNNNFYIRGKIETEDNVLLYEVPGVYNITNRFHQGKPFSSDTSQTALVPANISLRDDGNVFIVDSMNIEVIGFAGIKFFYNGGRALFKLDDVSQAHRTNGYTWSDRFVEGSAINGLSIFNQGLGNFGSLDAADGKITAAISRETNLLVWQENKVGYLLIDKDAIVTATGGEAITTSNKVVGQFIQYAGKYGTIHPRSIATSGGMAYFVDKYRGAICRLSGDGITKISDYKVLAQLNKFVDDNQDFIGVVDEGAHEYWAYGDADEIVFVFDEGRNGWTRVLTMYLEHAIIIKNDIYTIERDNVHKQGAANNNYGMIHGNNTPMTFRYVVNNYPAENWVFNTIATQSNVALNTEIFTDNPFNALNVQIQAGDYEEREGFFYANIPLKGELNSNYTAGGIIPLGEAASNNATTIILKNKFTGILPTVNHEIYFVNALGVPILLGDLVSLNVDEVVCNSTMTAGVTNNFLVYIKEKSYINGQNLLSPYLIVEYTFSDNEKIELFMSTLTGTKSNV